MAIHPITRIPSATVCATPLKKKRGLCQNCRKKQIKTGRAKVKELAAQPQSWQWEPSLIYEREAMGTVLKKIYFQSHKRLIFYIINHCLDVINVVSEMTWLFLILNLVVFFLKFLFLFGNSNTLFALCWHKSFSIKLLHPCDILSVCGDELQLCSHVSLNVKVITNSDRLALLLWKREKIEKCSCGLQNIIQLLKTLFAGLQPQPYTLALQAGWQFCCMHAFTNF